jgi:RNA polymerase sigma-70 factor (ECF subfamily)
VNLEETIRIEGGRVLATLIRFTGDIHLAEDALQDAVVVALATWTSDTMPENPAAWLTTTARRKALDRLRRESKRSVKEEEAIRLLDEAPLPDDGRDDRLRLVFTCSHPAIDPTSRVALSLKTVCGLNAEEIAAVFLVKTGTMRQRLTRAKKKIKEARIPYRVPEEHELPDRLPAVLATVNAVFTAGHHAAQGSYDSRVDLAEEGIRLARLLVELMPDEPECQGLLALFLATHARRKARTGPDGAMVLLADQDRSLWDHAAIAEASGIIDRALRRRRSGPFQVQAAVAVLHGLAPSYERTDWPQVVELYRALEELQPSIVVRVNRAVAEAEVAGPCTALELLEDIESDWHFLWAARAEMYRRLERPDESRRCLHRALSAEMNESDRSLLEQRLAVLLVG